MSFRFLRISVRALVFRSLAIGILLVPAIAFAAPGAPTGGTIPVIIDQAKLIRLPERVATIVVGNPLIADVTLQVGGIIVVTGKGYGATNFMAMDRNGEVLVDRMILVEGPNDHQIVTVYRGIERESYSCTPLCQPRVTLGDSERFFKGSLDQAGSWSGQAAGAAAAAKPSN